MFFEDDEEKAAYLREIQKESDRNYEDKHALMKHQDPEETDPEKRVSYLNHGPYSDRCVSMYKGQRGTRI